MDRFAPERWSGGRSAGLSLEVAMAAETSEREPMMRVDFTVSPSEDGWRLSRGPRLVNAFSNQARALEVADRFARIASQQENASVTLQQADGSSRRIAEYPREGFRDLY